MFADRLLACLLVSYILCFFYYFILFIYLFILFFFNFGLIVTFTSYSSFLETIYHFGHSEYQPFQLLLEIQKRFFSTSSKLFSDSLKS